MLTDLLGQELPTGRVNQRLEWSAAEGSLPSWLTAVAASTVFQAESAGIPYVEVSTTAVANNSAVLRYTDPIKQASLREMRWTVEGLRLSSSTSIRMMVGIWGTTGNRGSRVQEFQNDEGMSIVQIDGSGGQTALGELGYTVRLTPTRHHSFTYRVLLKEARALVILPNSGLVIGSVALGANGVFDETVYPRVQITTLENVAKTFRLSRVVLELIHN